MAKDQREQLVKLMASVEKKMRAAYGDTYSQVLKLAQVRQAIESGKEFTWSGNPLAIKQLEDKLTALAKKTESIVHGGTDTSWQKGNDSADNACGAALAKGKDAKETVDAMVKQGQEDMRKRGANAEQFYTEPQGGLTISKRVWKNVSQSKKELEIIIQNAILEGKSADEATSSVMQYLNEPDKLFRRVRDKETGELKLSKAALAYHPGPGVYRSSYQNALRLARTEINMAYRRAEIETYKDNPSVVGYRVVKSGNHTTKAEKGGYREIKDVCDELEGTYPKTFIFTGWHPNCRCHIEPVFISDKEFKERMQALKAGSLKDWKPESTVQKPPENFLLWVKKNSDRIRNAKVKPFFIRDNYKDGNIDKGLNDIIENIKITPAHDWTEINEFIKKNDQLRQDMGITSEWDVLLADVSADKYENAVKDMDTVKALIEKNIKSIKDDASSVLAKVGKIPDIDKSKMQEALDKNDYKTIKAETLSLQKYIDDLESLTLVDNPVNNAETYGYNAIMAAESAVNKTMQAWNSLPLAKQADKLSFEISWVENNKKYPTWKVTQDIYIKKYDEVKQQIFIDDAKAKINSLKLFSTTGKTYSDLLLKAEQALQTGTNKEITDAIDKVEKQKEQIEATRKRREKQKSNTKIITSDFDFEDSCFTDARRNGAVWYRDNGYDEQQKANEYYLPYIQDTWKRLSQDEKNVIYEYTCGSKYLNEPFYTKYVGYKTGINGAKQDIQDLQNAMLKSKNFEADIWVQSGQYEDTFEGIFGEDLYYYEKEPKKLIGLTGINTPFMSTSVMRGAGFTSKPVIFNIYMPKGARGLYVENISRFGGDLGPNWDGKKKAKILASEMEIIIPSGCKMRVTDAQFIRNKWYIDVDLIGYKTEPPKFI